MNSEEWVMAVRYRVLAALLGVVCTALAAATATADAMTAPQVSAPCSSDLADAMTLLPDGQTYVVCQGSGTGYAWTAVQTPFDPNDAWLSYGPPIQLHGQGMRNPNLSSGRWTATPLDAASVCKAEEQTVVEAGVLSDPQAFQSSAAGQPLSVQMLPKLFYVTLSGTCLWTRD